MGDKIRVSGPLDPRVYGGDQAINTQGFVESNVKNGVQYYISTAFTIATSGVKYLLFATGSDPVIVKSRLISADGGLEYRVFRGSTTTAAGTSVTIQNLNDIAPVTGATVVTQDPTVTDEGVEWDLVKLFNAQGQQTGGGVFLTEGVERVLAPSTEYLLKLENTDNKTIDIQFVVSWYEGPLSVDT